jgi:hypothetical protein
MTIYLTRPQNAGEAIRRVAKACGGGNPVQFCDAQDTVNGTKYALRRYSNGVDMQSVNGSLYVSGPKQLMAKAKIYSKGYFPYIAKFMDGKVKMKSLLTDVYHNIIDKTWKKVTNQEVLKEFLGQLEKTNNDGFYKFNLKSLAKLIKK